MAAGVDNNEYAERPLKRSNSLISFNAAKLLTSEVPTLGEYSGSLSDNLYLLFSHGASGTTQKYPPIKLRPGEQIIMNCIDGCLTYVYTWDVAMKSINVDNPTLGNPNYKNDIVSYLKSLELGDSLCVYEGVDVNVPEIKLTPNDPDNIRMGISSSQLLYIISVIVIIILLVIIYWFKEKFTFLSDIPDSGKYTGLDYPGTNDELKTRITNLMPTEKSSTGTSIASPLVGTPSTTAAATDKNITALQDKLKSISENYFKNEIKPQLEINRFIDNLQTRLDNIQLKLAEMNIKPQQELVFY